jgi:hypothetical protein
VGLEPPGAVEAGGEVATGAEPPPERFPEALAPPALLPDEPPTGTGREPVVVVVEADVVVVDKGADPAG